MSSWRNSRHISANSDDDSNISDDISDKDVVFSSDESSSGRKDSQGKVSIPKKSHRRKVSQDSSDLISEDEDESEVVPSPTKNESILQPEDSKNSSDESLSGSKDTQTKVSIGRKNHQQKAYHLDSPESLEDEDGNKVVFSPVKSDSIPHPEDSKNTSNEAPLKVSKVEEEENNVIVIDDDDCGGSGCATVREKKSRSIEIHPKNLSAERQIELINAKKIYELELLKEKTSLDHLKATVKKINIETLPDKGAKLRSSIEKQVQKVKELNEQITDISSTIVDKNSAKNTVPIPTKADLKLPSIVDLTRDHVDITEMGKRALATHQAQQSQTVEALEKLHKFLSLSGEEEADDPKGLKVSLLPHQRTGLAWLLKREKEFPAGGILADDMGLGKTLTIIALILKDIELNSDKLNQSDDDVSDDEEDDFRRRKKYPNGKTLVVCPSSVMGQWSSEVDNKVKRGLLSVYTHHGNKRERRPHGLASYDIVVTTYTILQYENKGDKKGPLLNVRWNRVVLDEGHTIRNHKSHTAQAVFGLRMKKKWVLTGTPIHNKQEDFFSLLKFLRCRPFDDLTIWKKMVDNRGKSGMERLHLLTKSLLLRRTKEEIQKSGGLKGLKPKEFSIMEVELDPEEFKVYDKISQFSSTLLAQYIAEKATKENLLENGLDIKRKGPSNPFSDHPELGSLYNKMLALRGGIKTHHILVLLLRLRQTCCHASLVTSLIDEQDLHKEGVEDEDGNDIGLVDQMMNLSLAPESLGDDSVVTNMSSDHSVFRKDRCSSKMRAVIDCVSDILETGCDKVIIVSQWTSVLEILDGFLKKSGIRTVALNGSIPVKDRISIINDFNNNKSGAKVLLLSLTAGGTGLNLVGGNHLLLIDIHWNPQLEAQACDRIYRVGQCKTVHIYKFLCKDTIEERILKLQNQKLELAKGVLTGSTNIQSSKLTLKDLKLLFDIKH